MQFTIACTNSPLLGEEGSLAAMRLLGCLAVSAQQGSLMYPQPLKRLSRPFYTAELHALSIEAEVVIFFADGGAAVVADQPAHEANEHGEVVTPGVVLGGVVIPALAELGKRALGTVPNAPLPLGAQRLQVDVCRTVQPHNLARVGETHSIMQGNDPAFCIAHSSPTWRAACLSGLPSAFARAEALQAWCTSVKCKNVPRSWRRESPRRWTRHLPRSLVRCTSESNAGL